MKELLFERIDIIYTDNLNKFLIFYREPRHGMLANWYIYQIDYHDAEKSVIESINGINNLLGHTILGLEVMIDSHDCSSDIVNMADDHYCIFTFSYALKTEKGICYIHFKHTQNFWDFSHLQQFIGGRLIKKDNSVQVEVAFEWWRKDLVNTRSIDLHVWTEKDNKMFFSGHSKR